MATPRLFVSSTCYDLQEIRFQLRNFIRDFGYDAVMSEFDDIFYNYESHVQDSCIEEINKCQLFILVVGNNYGSFYHQDKQDDNIPESVTLREFRRALDVKIYKHIFINKYVEYDYKNYKRALDKVILKHFQKNNIPNDETDNVRNQVKRDFDEQYHFPYDSYKFVFYFLDIIHEIKEGNAINTFESFSDIKDTLRKQWANFMYESLTKKDKVQTIIQPLETKIDRIEKNISKLFESKTNEKDNQITFDLSSLTRETNIENLIKLQDEIQTLLSDVTHYTYYDFDEGFPLINKRITFSKKFSSEMVKEWLEYLKPLTQSFKWSKDISVVDVFKGLPFKYNKHNFQISYKTLFELFTLYNSFEETDKNNLVNTIREHFNLNYEAPIVSVPKDDDLPF
ncbi:DUF4062 domain-containing protein [Flavobacterium soyae]|uniref:DUF4062 domain-containing protein n=1 Tax=Flavobacterium soyae TaxID=2903098 RepID=UPI001E413A49|nr:DUF4062 domain-containing protein [Flavobacterium soyae]MCD9576507.1 DUF4062 domain-containing protein [Flavobacterium soyae]